MCILKRVNLLGRETARFFSKHQPVAESKFNIEEGLLTCGLNEKNSARIDDFLFPRIEARMFLPGEIWPIV